jgi:uncharacterized membrane protein YhaH (DUF805 family)
MPYNDQSSIQAFLAAYFLVLAIIIIASIVFNIVVYWRICAKAGFSGAMSLLIFVPFGALILLCILAFGDWPALRGRETPVVQFNQFQGQAGYPQQAQSPYPQQNPPYGQQPYPQQGSNPNYPNYQ